MAHLPITGSESEAAVDKELHDECNHVVIWDHVQQLEVESMKPYSIICSS